MPAGNAHSALPRSGIRLRLGAWLLLPLSVPCFGQAAGVPAINPGGIVNAASYGTAVAPGSIAAVFGNFVLSSPSRSSTLPLPTDLSQLSMQFDGALAAPLFYADGGQVNIQIPWELASHGQAMLTVTVNGQTSAPQAIDLVAYAPGVFSMNAQGTGQGAILDNSSYRLVDASNPATAGSTFIQIYCTGLGAVTNQPPSGSPAPSSPPFATTTTTPTVTIGGVPAPVAFAGLAPGFVGLYQVNAQVPAAAPSGTTVPVVISIGGATSNTVTVAVQSSITAVTVTPSSATTSVGQTQQFSAAATDASGNALVGKMFTWASSNTSVATVDNTGKATGVAAGAATISAASEGVTGAATLTVTAASGVAVTISPTSATVQTGAPQQFTATVTGSSDTGVTWSVAGVQGGNPIVGAVSTTGLYTAPSSVPSTNPVTVTATSVADSTKSASARVTIIARGSALSITSLSSTSALPLSPLTIGTSGLDPNAPVQVQFLGSSNYSVTESPVSVGSDGTMVVGVPLYVDPNSGQTADAIVSVVVTQGGQSTAPASLEIQDLPPVSAYGVDPGEISRAVLVFNAILAAQRLNQLQAFQMLPGNTVDTSRAQTAMKTRLDATIAMRSDIDRVAADSSLVISEGTRADGTAIQFDRTSLDLMDRVHALFLSQTFGPLISSLPSSMKVVPGVRARARPQALGAGNWIRDTLAVLQNQTQAQDILNAAIQGATADDWVKKLEAGATATEAVIDMVGAEHLGGLFNKHALGIGAAVLSQANTIGDTFGNLAAFMTGVGTHDQALQNSAIQAMRASNENGELYSTLFDLSLLLLTGPSVTAAKPVVAIGGNVLGFIKSGYDLATDAAEAATDQTVQELAAEYPWIAFDSAHGVAQVTGTLPALTIPPNSQEQGITKPQSGASLCGFGGASLQCLTGIGDVSGNYVLYVPLQVARTNYAALTMSATDPLSGVSFGSEVVDLRGLNTNTPVQVPPISIPTTPPQPGTYAGTCTAQYSAFTCCDGEGDCDTDPGGTLGQWPFNFTLAPGTSLSQFTSELCASMNAGLSAAGCTAPSCYYTAATSTSATFTISCTVQPLSECTPCTITETCSATQQ
jgi:uncharacterized protein (TIGR03437 family)